MPRINVSKTHETYDLIHLPFFGGFYELCSKNIALDIVTEILTSAL